MSLFRIHRRSTFLSVLNLHVDKLSKIDVPCGIYKSGTTPLSLQHTMSTKDTGITLPKLLKFAHFKFVSLFVF